MRILLSLVGSLLIFSGLYCQQPIGSWSDHLNYNSAKDIAVSQEEVFASTGSSIIVYNRAFNELRKLSRVTGLSETGISSIAWSRENRTLIIGYRSANIDLVSGTTIYNIPDILNSYIPGTKKINRIITSGAYAYMATSFGIVLVDMVKREIRDTWKPGPDPEANEVYDIALGNDKIYAATSRGIWTGNIHDQGLAYFRNWERISALPDPESRCTCILFYQNKLYVNVSPQSLSGDSVFVISDETKLLSYVPGLINRSFDGAASGFLISSAGLLRYLSTNGSIIHSVSSYGWGIPDLSRAVQENDAVWLADSNYGLIKSENMSVFNIFSMPGPGSEHVENISSCEGNLIICEGGIGNALTGKGRAFQVSVYANKRFEVLDAGSFRDAVRACPEPGNPGHIYVSSWGNGLIEYDDLRFVRSYDRVNTPALAINSGNPGTRIFGLAMDRFRNLWITQTGNSGSLKILKPDGSWIVNPLTIDAPMAGDIISARNGLKWVVLPGGYGMFVLDDNSTPEVFNDDRGKTLPVMDEDGNNLSNTFSVAEDLDGNIWVGTDHGPVIYYNPDLAFEGDLKAGRLKVPRDDGSGLADYMLGTETITSIAVDGANRKWLGTQSSGVYLLSADGTRMVKNYNTRNSPLYSDSIASVAIDNITGEVWFGTSKGALSVREVATSGGEKFTNVYAFPNPVREDYNGNVTITGLMRDSQIKITNITGDLVNEMVSEGGQAVWDLTTYTGSRVTTGVYLVFCSAGEGSGSFITKILVIGR